MNDEPGGDQPGGDRPGEPVGSVGEEAAKLFAALSGWARDQGIDHVGSAAGAAAAMSETMHAINEHIATGSEDCRYCPLCQVIHAVRTTSPEVKAHLTVAASSLMHAVAGVLATQTGSDRSSPVQKIDLDDNDWDET